MADDYDFWLFDLDGTLVDIEPWYPRSVLSTVGDRLGHTFTDREMEILWYGVGGTRDQHLREWDVDPATFWETFHDVEDPQRRAEATYLYDDAAFVGDIDGPVGLVTHCQPFLTGPVLDALDIGDWFDAVVCCDDEVGWKPDPNPVELTMAQMDVGYNGHAGVLAGDDPYDVGAAWNAGLDAVHVERHDPERRGQCVLGDHRVDSLTELAEKLN
jgi:phosphoglycolate phosphatase